MADIRPFPGFRYDARQAPLGRALCPPYDVIDAAMAAGLRADPVSAVHLELPEGGDEKYSRAARLWADWRQTGLLRQDDKPAFYVVEERFRAPNGKSGRRVGFLAALSVKPADGRWIIAHERTLSKPKEDRLKLLDAVRANVSPIFGIFPDRTGAVRRGLKKTQAGKPAAQGRMKSGVQYKLWLLDDAEAAAAISKAVKASPILIADGHHRCEVSRAYYLSKPSSGTETVLAYLCPEEDSGLVVLPTHRIVAGKAPVAAASRLAALTPCKSQAEMLKRLAAAKNPYAFGLYDGRFHLGVPKKNGGCKSGLCVEWVGKVLLADVAPDDIRYTPDAGKAVVMARESAGTAVFVKPFPVPQIRKAVKAVGLLPPKSTYFFPKIATGLVFKSLD